MKQFAILTFYNHINYGAVLQATALQYIVSKLGYKSYFLRYKHEMMDEVSKENILKKILSSISIFVSNPLAYVLTFSSRKRRYVKFNEFCNDFQKVSPKYYETEEELKSQTSEYNGFISGSDMVWSPSVRQNLDYFFMTFAPKEKRLSYAPSLTGTQTFTQETKELFKSYLNGVTGLSCREEEGVEFIKSLTERQPQLVLDPTLLLNKNEWSEFLKFTIIDENVRPYILCYMFGGTPKSINSNLKVLAKKLNLEIRYIPMSLAEYYNEFKLGYSGCYGPKEFVELFINAKFVVTNSYHGLMFSLISENPFVLYHRDSTNYWKNNESRMANILQMVNLKDRYLNLNQKIEERHFDIDYKLINKSLNRSKEMSLSYLSTILSNS